MCSISSSHNLKLNNLNLNFVYEIERTLNHFVWLLFALLVACILESIESINLFIVS